MEVYESLISKIHTSFTGGLHFASPFLSVRTTEFELVRGVLQIFQGLSSSLFHWDHNGQRFRVKNGIYVTHLSQGSLRGILDKFLYAATCLQLVENRVNKIQKFSGSVTPTLGAFACSVSTWLRRLREVALREEEKIIVSGTKTLPTLLGLSSSLSSLCSGAEYLLQIVHGAIPEAISEFDSSVSAADVATHILNHLYRNINEICLVHGGEVVKTMTEDAFRMLLYIFMGTLFPYIEGLDSWLFEGTLDDPYEEMFFYANKAISIDETEFWEKSYLLKSRTFRKLELDSHTNILLVLKDKKDMTGSEAISVCSTKEKEGKDRDAEVCPMFIKDMAKAIVSAGKSLQLIRHAPTTSSAAVSTDNQNIDQCGTGLTLSEAFCVSLAALVGHSDHISEYVWKDNLIISSFESPVGRPKKEGSDENFRDISHPDKIWCKFLSDTLDEKREIGIALGRDAAVLATGQKKLVSDRVDDIMHIGPFCPQNPATTVCQKYLHENDDARSKLNLSRSLQLPSLNDEDLRKAIFDETDETYLMPKGTHYSFGFQGGESELQRQQEDGKMLEMLFPFPTLLPSFEEDLPMSEYLPFQKSSTLPSRTLCWIQNLEPKGTSLPIVILQESLVNYIKKQADYIGRNMLLKLLYDWRLLDELGLLRAIYLLGSGDLLHHFLAVIFNKLDKGESLDDEFELNTILQESIRNSADGTLLSSPDSLVLSIKSTGFGEDGQPSTSTPRKSRGQSNGVDVLESLKFAYKVSWPLELIANMEAIRKYNQVMIFLLKVKRAKYVLDKARRWMWKDRGMATTNHKRHWLLEQKLLHFVDAFHQYVMDRVYHSAWRELCDGVAAAGSLDEVIEVHESYLLLIQRLSFVVPDKLWALIASRINTILGLSLDFYSIQQTLSSGAVSAIKARCEMELDRIEKQFDECITFLLRILSFKLNVGQFPHLADLVTRINYNYFYMSDGGGLKTTSGSENIASKIGKAFQKPIH